MVTSGLRAFSRQVACFSSYRDGLETTNPHKLAKCQNAETADVTRAPSHRSYRCGLAIVCSVRIFEFFADFANCPTR